MYRQCSHVSTTDADCRWFPWWQANTSSEFELSSPGPIDTMLRKCSDESMPKAEGKGWAKGRTAATDPRVARAAAGHTGKQYVHRKPLSDMKWARVTYTTLPIEWSAKMAYIVGLTATDGCLASGRRAINFKSADRQLVETYLQLLGRTNKIGCQRTKTGGIAHQAQFSDTRLYRWFQSIGLTPRKSLRSARSMCPMNSWLR